MQNMLIYFQAYSETRGEITDEQLAPDNAATPDRSARCNPETTDEQLAPDNAGTPDRSARCSELSSMTPNTRKRKSRIAKELTDHLIGLNLTPEEEVAILKLTARQRGLEDMFQSEFAVIKQKQDEE